MIKPPRRSETRRYKASERESETRDRLIDAALFEFADRGILAATLRDITDRAGANIAAVNYHFGSKEGLIRSVLEYCLTPFNEARLRALAKWDQLPPRKRAVATLVDALVRPVVEHSVDTEGGRAPIRLLLQVRAIPDPLTIAVLSDQLDRIHERFLSAFREALPHLSAEDVAIRYDFARGAVLQILGDLDPAARNQPGLRVAHSSTENERVIRQLNKFVTAGFLAPPVSVSKRPARARAHVRKNRSRQYQIAV